MNFRSLFILIILIGYAVLSSPALSPLPGTAPLPVLSGAAEHPAGEAQGATEDVDMSCFDNDENISVFHWNAAFLMSTITFSPQQLSTAEPSFPIKKPPQNPRLAI